MRYALTPIFCRPWLLNGLSTRLIESEEAIALNSTRRALTGAGFTWRGRDYPAKNHAK